MDIYEYISNFLECTPIEIDGIDEIFLQQIGQGYSSAYKLYSFMKNEYEGPMAYKNVHRRIRRMFQAGLIEEIRKVGGYKHGAINYGLTSRGLVYLFSEGLIPPKLSTIITTSYSGNPLFRTFVSPYFNRDTLDNYTDTLSRMLVNYLEEISEIIRFMLNPMRLEKWGYDSNKPYSKQEYPLNESPVTVTLRFQLNWCIKSFIFKIASMNHEHVDWRESKEPSLEDKSKTLYLLSRDKKYMNALKEARTEFIDGYNKMMSYSSLDYKDYKGQTYPPHSN
jgi:hypothetical protein